MPHRISLERYTYRGAGGLAHKMLRSDPLVRSARAEPARTRRLWWPTPKRRSDVSRWPSLSRPRAGGSGRAVRGRPRVRTAVPSRGGPAWTEALRDGVANIVERHSAPRAKRVELLLHWVPYCIARYQLDVARGDLRERGRRSRFRSTCARPANTIRRASQRELARCPVSSATRLRGQRPTGERGAGRGTCAVSTWRIADSDSHRDRTSRAPGRFSPRRCGASGR